MLRSGSVTDDRPTVSEANEELIDRLREMVERLQAEQADTVPAEEPYLRSASAVKGAVKRGVFRLTRPATRRSDRLATEVAAALLDLAEQVRGVSGDVERMHGDLDRHDRALQMGRGTPTATPGPGGDAPSVDDAYYWAFEGRMRGDQDSVVERLRQYERLAVPLRDRFMAVGDDGADRPEPPLWLDLGCGLGELCELVRDWGWKVQGVDSSPRAVDACRAKGIDVTLADVDAYLETRRGEPPAAISAIQVIEHVPRDRWIGSLQRIHDVLEPGGAMLLETINGLNAEAVLSYFLADVTHTWPGHPETLRLMAEHAGFADVEVMFLNPDQRGNAQDFAIWATKGDDERPRGPAPAGC